MKKKETLLFKPLFAQTRYKGFEKIMYTSFKVKFSWIMITKWMRANWACLASIQNPLEPPNSSRLKKVENVKMPKWPKMPTWKALSENVLLRHNCIRSPGGNERSKLNADLSLIPLRQNFAAESPFNHSFDSNQYLRAKKLFLVCFRYFHCSEEQNLNLFFNESCIYLESRINFFYSKFKHVLSRCKKYALKFQILKRCSTLAEDFYPLNLCTKRRSRMFMIY